MGELTTATLIADVDLDDDVEIPINDTDAPGLLRLTLLKIKTYLKIPLFSAGDAGQSLLLNTAEDAFVFGYPTSPVITEAATTANLLNANKGKYQRWTDAAAKTLVVQPNATEALDDNGEWHVRNVGAADLTFSEGAGVTITPPNGGTLAVPQDGTVTLKRVAVNEFDLLGQTIAL